MTTQSANLPWQQTATETANASRTDTYLNIEIQVGPNEFIRMPLNCPVAGDIKGMSAKQKKLMAALIRKVDAALLIEDEDERAKALTLKAPIRATLYKVVALSDEELESDEFDAAL